MAFPGEWSPEGSAGGPAESKLVPLSMQSSEAVFLKTLLARTCHSATLIGAQRVQNKRLWRAYARCRDDELPRSGAGGDGNETLLFHDTAGRPAADVLAHPHGLDPCFSQDGAYGKGIYLAEDPSHAIGGQRVHRLPGSAGRRVQLLVVRAALGVQREMGQRVSKETRAMCAPGILPEGPSRLLHDSVRGEPHGPFLSRGAEQWSGHTSIVHVLYEPRQMYPAYVIDVEMTTEDEVVAAVENRLAESDESIGPASKRQRRAAPSGSGGSSSGASNDSRHAAAQIPTARLQVGPPSDAEVLAMHVAAVVEALQMHALSSHFVAVALQRLIELCEVENEQRQSAAEAGAIKAVVAALRSHLQVASVQKWGCGALLNMCTGNDAEALARKKLAAAEHAIEAVLAALGSHLQVAHVQDWGCRALCSICHGTDADVIERKQSALEKGAVKAIVTALCSHRRVTDVQFWGCRALGSICRGTDAGAPERKQSAPEEGAIQAVVAALRTHPLDANVQRGGCGVLLHMCGGTDSPASTREELVSAGAIKAVATALRSHPQVAQVQEWGCRVMITACEGRDAAAPARKPQAIAEGMVALVAVALREYPANANIQKYGRRLSRLLSV